MKRNWKRMCAAALALLCMQGMGLAEPVQNEAQVITKECEFYSSAGKVYKLHDGSLKTDIRFGAGGKLGVMLPAGRAGYVQLEWTEAPVGYRLVQYDGERVEIAAQEQVARHSGITMVFPLDERAEYVFVEMNEPGQKVAEVIVHSRGSLPENVMDWEAPHEKCDLMVISTHQDDEWLWFAGIIPYYDLVQDKDVQVVYMANCGRYRYNEALRGLWAGGMRNYPELLGLKDERLDSMDKTLRHWGGEEKLLGKLVNCIRKYKPEVILTHDWNGEYGHNQHKLTSRSMEAAIEAAADPARYPESAQMYGPWQVKKLYRHLETKGQITFDWHQSYEQLGGKTPMEVAILAYDQHKSQHEYYQVQDKGKYDNSIFGLSYSTVGEDQLHQDLFENIPSQE